MKCATVSVIGRPSVGKSTLINTICEMKVSITAPTPQTTRNAIRGIYTDQRGQLIFTDTPGYHLGGKTINKRMQDITVSALGESDMILYLVDASRALKEEEEAIAEILSKVKVPIIAVLNKSDILSEEQKKDAIFFINHNINAEKILECSGLNDEGVDEVLIALFKLAKEGDLLYSENAYTDQPLEFRISEIIREKTINLLDDELPHVIYVEVADIEYNEEEKSVWVRAFIITERDGQKGIIVGKGGENIKKIRKESFKEIKKIFPGSTLQLDLRVKAQAKWRTNQVVLDKIFKTL
ncbi:MAG: GTPase Era [Spirochaetales bacterium]|uniref:GTPase Era n=1 Tax=Bullifex sp. TaxID=2815808 RepID=UPI002A538034|nr:GTPase Era [Bullifex sp.]MDD7270619.1 GTPase Era [Spirochaetales bacterium]MDY4066192.1 GTPase Era [Bullifex sp.]